MKTFPTTFRNERGSLLIVSMILCAIIGISLVSYLTMARTALNLSLRSSMANEAMNLTEIGLEQAMASINASSWTGWTSMNGGADMRATFPSSGSYSLSNGATGVVKTYVQNYNSSAPTIISKAVVTPGGASSTTITKMVLINGVISRSLFAKGLVGKNGVSFTGNNPSVDSWDSTYNDDGTARASPAAYSDAVKHDDGSIAAVNVTASDSVQNADIFGTASVGGSSTDLITVGPNGKVGPFGTANGVKDPNNISANFTANLPTPTAPTPSVTNSITNINSATTLPSGGDTAASDGVYYYNVSGGISLSGAATKILSVAANRKVVLIMTGSATVSLTGNASISIPNGSNLAIYSPNSISIAGNGVANGNDSTKVTSFQIWGTNSTEGGQSISVSGNGSLAATVYAPNANVTANGGGTNGVLYGAIVGYTISMSGNTAFHYDENLARSGGSGTYSPGKWIELASATDRSTYNSYVSF